MWSHHFYVNYATTSKLCHEMCEHNISGKGYNEVGYSEQPDIVINFRLFGEP